MMDDDDTPVPVMGGAEAASGERTDRAKARIYLPDPEQRRGWREYYVHAEDTKPQRGVGFRKPGER